nr:KH domain-containing protein [Clostridia bacterium]
MIELIKFVVGTFAENKDAVIYDVNDDGKTVNVSITLDSADMGKVIGRQGKIAKALRTLVKAGSLKENKKYNIEIREKDAE